MAIVLVLSWSKSFSLRACSSQFLDFWSMFFNYVLLMLYGYDDSITWLFIYIWIEWGHRETLLFLLYTFFLLFKFFPLLLLNLVWFRWFFILCYFGLFYMIVALISVWWYLSNRTLSVNVKIQFICFTCDWFVCVYLLMFEVREFVIWCAWVVAFLNIWLKLFFIFVSIYFDALSRESLSFWNLRIWTACVTK